MLNKPHNTISLLVLSHGLWGVKRHMEYLKKKLQDKYKHSVFVLNIDVNESKYSYDGVDICGQRAAGQVEATLKQLNAMGKKVSKISFIGYSLGGLILRYAIGVLGEKKLFDSVEPDYFATFASPHMGTKLPGNTLWSNFFNYVSGNFVSHSGEQLQLKDSPKNPLLYTLSDPDDIFFKHLAKFKVKRSYANIANDRTVPYWTSGMETMDYFDETNNDIEIVTDDKYGSIVTEIRTKTDYVKRKRELKANLVYFGFYLSVPILLPIVSILAFIYVCIQNIYSRNRVSQYWNDKSSGTRRPSNNSHFMAGELMAGELLTSALDMINIPEGNSDSIQESTHHDINTKKHYYHVQPSPFLKKKFKRLDLDPTTLKICRNLRQIDWEITWVYLDVFNAHGSIICRQKVHITEVGETTIQHFLDTSKLA